MVNDAFRGYVRSIIIALALQIYSFGNESCISIKRTNFLLGYFPKSRFMLSNQLLYPQTFVHKNNVNLFQAAFPCVAFCYKQSHP